MNILQQALDQQCTIRIAGLSYKPSTKSLSDEAGLIDIEPRSIELLEVLLSSVGQPVSGDDIIKRVWQSEYISKNVLTNRISTLRALFKAHSTQDGADKAIVTYPKKGYYIQPDSVSIETLEVKDPQLPVNSAESEPSNNTSNAALHAIYLSIVFTLLVSVIIFGKIKDELPSPSNANSSDLKQRATIPVVEISLNRFKVKDENAKRYSKQVKAIVLNKTLNYPYIDVKNQDSPSYFIDPINDGRFWPGGTNVLDYDYKLNIAVASTDDPELLLAGIELIYKGSNRLAFKAEYRLSNQQLSRDIQVIVDDLAIYLSLPAPDAAEEFDLARLDVAINGDTKEVISLINKASKLTNLETAVVARRALLSLNLEEQWVRLTIKKIESSAQYPTEETAVWLGLLHNKIGEPDAALEYLKKHRSYNSIHNAYLYAVLSSLSLRTEQISDFRLFYLKSIEALSEAIPSEQLFRRLSLPENQKSCYRPWAMLKLDALNPDLSGHVLTSMKKYCVKVEEYLQPVK